MKSSISLALICVYLFANTGCAFKAVTRSKEIVYLSSDSSLHREAQKLNVFAPSHYSSLKEVLIFIHGGRWNSGKKSLYSFLGNRMARKNIVTVIIDYPKSPQANYREMAMDAALAVKWVKGNIERFGGDTGKIYISGHSAGGHLAALLAVSDEYFNKAGIASPLKGVILIDAAGLDMYSFLVSENLSDGNTLLNTFTTNPANWKDASPLYHLHQGLPPMLIYTGEKTYPSIKESSEKFVDSLKSIGYHPQYLIIQGKKHIPMITQFLNSGNNRYKEIIDFMRQPK
ncbi:MAG: alpha/beta hydrolase [Ferruginibacter sp.]